MRYIKPFNESYTDSFNTEEYFNPFINWDLFRYIQDKVTEYIDNGHKVTPYIGYTWRENGLNSCDIYRDTQVNGEYWVQDYKKDFINDIRNGNIKRLIYGVSFSGITNEQLSKIPNIKQRISEKFKVSINTNYTFAFDVPININKNETP